MDKRVLVALLAVVSFPLAEINPGQSPFQFSFLAGYSQPLGKFSETKAPSEGSGYATWGWGLEGRFGYHLVPGLYLMMEMAGISHNISDEFEKDGRDDIETSCADQMPCTILAWENSSWKVFPLLTGLMYQGNLTSLFALYASGQLGMSFVKGNDVEMDVYFPDDDLTIKSNAEWSVANTFTLGLGGGIVLWQRLNLSLRYLYLGNPRLKATISTRFTENGNSFIREASDSQRKEISILYLSVGLNI